MSGPSRTRLRGDNRYNASIPDPAGPTQRVQVRRPTVRSNMAPSTLLATVLSPETPETPFREPPGAPQRAPQRTRIQQEQVAPGARTARRLFSLSPPPAPIPITRGLENVLSPPLDSSSSSDSSSSDDESSHMISDSAEHMEIDESRDSVDESIDESVDQSERMYEEDLIERTRHLLKFLYINQNQIIPLNDIDVVIEYYRGELEYYEGNRIYIQQLYDRFVPLYNQYMAHFSSSAYSSEDYCDSALLLFIIKQVMVRMMYMFIWTCYYAHSVYEDTRHIGEPLIRALYYQYNSFSEKILDLEETVVLTQQILENIVQNMNDITDHCDFAKQWIIDAFLSMHITSFFMDHINEFPIVFEDSSGHTRDDIGDASDSYSRMTE